MEKNEVFTARCEDLTDQGYGLVHFQGTPVFVSNLLPGEEAEIKIIKTAKKYAIGKVMRRLNDSPDRTEAACPKASQCGGCSFQHLSYPAQLAGKQKQLEHLFHGVNPDIEVLPILESPKPFGYRNKAQFPVTVQDHKVTGGFYKARTNEICPVRTCLIQNGTINQIYQWLLDHLSEEQAKGLRHLFIRSSEKTGQSQVVFIGKENRKLKKLAEKLREAFPQIVSVVFNRNEGKDNVILGKEYEVLAGRDYIEEDCLGLKVKLHFKSFFQVNPEGMERLYQTAMDMADLQGDEDVIELYSGTGTIGMLAAKHSHHVTGVEIEPEAVANAKENARLNHIENIDFVCMDASKFAAENKEAASTVFVDPPRKGMTQQGIEDIVRIAPKKIVYISCNPHTLARDLKEFESRGYFCKKIQPVDMFAQTAGVENVALLEKEEKN